ncbi:MliC family protein [Vreelandella rituensis]|nr:MliC family protein [Halomonas rituensis]
MPTAYFSACLPAALFVLLSGCVAPAASTDPVPAGTASTSASAAFNTAPLLPSSFFAGGAEQFSAWHCQPANQHLVTATTGNGELRLWSLHGAWQLPAAVVASGARYQAGDISFWNRGEQAQVETPRGQLQCRLAEQRDVFTRSDHPGVMFRGQGNEPGWSVDLAHDTPTLSLVLDYATREETRAYRVSVMDNENGRVVLESTRPDQPFRLRLEAGACFDDMSGKPFPTRVTLTFEGTQYSGCGQGITPGS